LFLFSLTAFLFAIMLNKYILIKRLKKGSKYHNISILILYILAVVFGSTTINPPSPLFAPFFAAYIVHVADSLHKFKF